jgi:hypothetical protein
MIAIELLLLVILTALQSVWGTIVFLFKKSPIADRRRSDRRRAAAAHAGPDCSIQAPARVPVHLEYILVPRYVYRSLNNLCFWDLVKTLIYRLNRHLLKTLNC